MDERGEAHVKVQEITTSKGPRYLLLDDDYMIIDPAMRYLEYLDKVKKSPDTIRAHAFDLKLYFEFLGARQLTYEDLCKPDGKGPVDILSDFVQWLQYPSTSDGIYQFGGEKAVRKNATVNRIVSSVLGFYRYLSSNKEVEELDVYRYIRQSPRLQGFLGEMMHRKTIVASNIFKLPDPDKKVEGITRDQYDQLRGVCLTRRDRVLVGIMYEGATRLGETLGIHLEDLVNIPDGEIRIVSREENENEARVKRHSDREIYIPPYLVQDIVDYIIEDLTDVDSDYLFVNLAGPNIGKPMDSVGVEALFKRLSKRVGFKVHPHMLRHGFAEEKLDSDWQMVDIKAFLGHKSVKSTEIYATHKPEKIRRKVKEYIDAHSDKLQSYRNKSNRAAH